MTEVTYAQLDKALSSLGFSVRLVNDPKKLRVYENNSGARLALAHRPDSDIVLPHHFGAVEGTLRIYGIADQMDFLARLLKAG